MSAPDYPVEGLIGYISFGGTTVGHLIGVELSGDRSVTHYRAMGTYSATTLLRGRRNFEGSARKAFLCGDFLTLFLDDCGTFGGTFFPRYGHCTDGATACGTIAGSLIFTGWRLTGWEAEAEAAKIEELTFAMYAVSRGPWP